MLFSDNVTTTIYIPERHAEHDPRLIASFMETYSFAMVITAHGGAGGVQISNVPTLLENSDTLLWHLALPNPQNEALRAGAETTVVFHGPHSYISPNWYETAHAVPTWNFAAVHCTGTPRRIDDDAELEASLARLVERNESRYAAGATRWQLAQMPPQYLAGLRRAIAGYTMRIDRVEAKFKLGQERQAADRAGVLRALQEDKGREKSLAELTAEYYARLGR